MLLASGRGWGDCNVDWGMVAAGSWVLVQEEVGTGDVAARQQMFSKQSYHAISCYSPRIKFCSQIMQRRIQFRGTPYLDASYLKCRKDPRGWRYPNLQSGLETC